jgi:hypothetical protein
MSNCILSYPGSGNNLTRFFIELLSEQPTDGWDEVPDDVAIYKATFARPVPFNITDITPTIYKKEHIVPEKNRKYERLIILLRNPKEVLIRQAGFNLHNVQDGYFINTEIINYHFNLYFNMVNYYNDFKGPKKVFYYEDMLQNKTQFVKELYDFLNINKPEKLKYALDNIDGLYELSLKGTNRIWLGAKSDISLSYYFKKLAEPAQRFFCEEFSLFLNSAGSEIVKAKYLV